MERAGASGFLVVLYQWDRSRCVLKVHTINCLVLGQDLPGNRFNAEFAFVQIDTAVRWRYSIAVQHADELSVGSPPIAFGVT